MKTHSFILACLTLAFFSVSITVLQANLNNDTVDSSNQIGLETTDDLYTIQFADGTSVTYAVNGNGVQLQKTNATNLEDKLQDCDCGIPGKLSSLNPPTDWNCVKVVGTTICSCVCD